MFPKTFHQEYVWRIHYILKITKEKLKEKCSPGKNCNLYFPKHSQPNKMKENALQQVPSQLHIWGIALSWHHSHDGQTPFTTLVIIPKVEANECNTLAMEEGKRERSTASRQSLQMSHQSTMGFPFILEFLTV